MQLNKVSISGKIEGFQKTDDGAEIIISSIPCGRKELTTLFTIFVPKGIQAEVAKKRFSKGCTAVVIDAVCYQKEGKWRFRIQHPDNIYKVYAEEELDLGIAPADEFI